MFNDLFLTTSLQSDFSFGFTTDLSASFTPVVTTGPGDITVDFPIFDTNLAPILEDDTATTEAGTAVEIDVLANDSDPDGDELVILATSGAVYGSVSVVNNVVTYTPDEDFSGTDTFTYTVFDGTDFAEASVTVNVEPEPEPEEPTGEGDKSGFELVNVNDFFNPAFGGGFIATYEYTVNENSIIGDDLFAWTINSNYTGEGRIVNVFVNGFNGPTTQQADDGSFDIGNVDVGFRPELNVGDTFRVSFQIDGAGFEDEHFCPTFLDSDPEPVEATESDVEIITSPTNDWGSGFLQRVTIDNISEDEIDGWSVILDVPEGDTFVFNNVWGATAETLDNGDILFQNLSWNEDIAVGGSVNFGFTGDNSTNDTVSLDEFDFTFLG